MRGRALAMLVAGLGAPRLARAQQPQVVTVQADPRSSPPTELTLPAARAAEGAGTQGDAVKALQSLPGLGRGGLGSDFVAWGSEPRESSIEIDGVEVPRLYHGSGVRSVLLPALIDSLSVTPGAFGVEHGRATGGLVELRTRGLPLDAVHVRASVDTLDATATASAPFADGHGAALVGARYGYVDRWLPAALDSKVRGLYEVPSYWDASAAVELELPRRRRARLVALTSSDSEAFALASQDPSRTRSSERSRQFGRVFVNYRSAADDDARVEVTPFVGWDDSEHRETIGGGASLSNVSALRYGLRAQHRARVSEALSLTLGLDAAGTSARITREGSLSVPRREGDPYPFGTPPGASFARDDFSARSVGVGTYAKLELRAGRFSVTPAIRFEPTLLEASRSRPPLGGLPDIGTSRVEFLAEPRLFAEARLARAVRLFAAGGLYHQPPDLADLGARFGNPLLEVSKATHVAFGESANLTGRTRLELTVFSKWLSGLPVRVADPAPRQAEAITASGEGRAFGAQLFFRQGEIHGFSGSLSVTLSRSERREPGAPYRLSDYDAPLAMALVVEKVLGAWKLGARARYSSGAPRTPVVGAYYDLATDSFAPELGALNSARLRTFWQLDLRVDRHFQLSERTRLELYLDLLNVTFRHNQEELVYASDFRSRGSVSGLPPLAVLGLKVER